MNTMSTVTKTTDEEMFVIKRDGSREPVSFDKVLERIRKAARGLSVNYTRLAQLVLAEIHDGVHTTELDELAARLAISFMTTHPDWAALAAQIIISNCQRNAPATFSAAMEELAALTDSTGRPTPALAADITAFIRTNAAALDAMVNPVNDFLLDYFGFKTLEKAYLMKGRNRRIAETPQYMWLRVSVGLWANSGARALDRIEETYTLMSTKAFTHATPTLFNSGTPRPQMSSCFLAMMKNDSIDGIFDTLKECAQISKYAGGIGLHVHNIRAQGTTIAGTQGTSNGLVPMLRVFNNTARYVDQCFAADTLIYTRRGDKRIADIEPGDLVFTSGGSETVEDSGKHYVEGSGFQFNKVLKRLEHTYSGQLYHITFSSGITVTVTPKHPFLIQESSGEWDYVEAEKLYVGAKALFTVTEITTSAANNLTLYDLEVEGTHDYTVQGVGIVHNGGGKRNGSFAIYLEPWHADIQAFLKMKSNTGAEEERARDLFYALWIPDLFMRRVEAAGDWSLFCPHEAPGLADAVGADFEALYTRYEAEGRAKRTVPAQKLWSEILVSQIETGTPYLLYKDAANAKSNQKNLGTIKSSNLCVAPETLIEIYSPRVPDPWEMEPNKRGMDIVPIRELVGDTVAIWNGNGYSDVTVHQTGTDQHLLHVHIRQVLPSGSSRIRTLDCTEYHKFIAYTPEGFLASAPRLQTTELRPGMRLCDYIDEAGTHMEQYVAAVIDNGRYDDTYCFSEPINHAGVFNGILTGQCTEIIEYSSPEETAVCNLASIALPYFLEPASASAPPSFNFDRLRAVTAVIVRNLNRVIDINYYPTPETRRSNMRHRPVGLGVQGLADVFAQMGLAWESAEAAHLNREIFENIYYAALDMSNTMATHDGAYETFAGSPASAGQIQPDLWSIDPATYTTADYLDWTALRSRIQATGLRNSLLMAPMPTASTSQILGYNECIEPFTTNIYVRRTLAGEFTVINKYLIADLMAAGLWSAEMKERIVAANGSIQAIPAIPAALKERYKTVWEIKQKTLIDMAADRGAFICQSQSLNLFVSDPTIAKLSSMHFYAWRRGLKTGIYYLRTKSAVQAIKFTVDPTLMAAASTKSATTTEPAECLLCSA
jgi:ribonucleotide reductase alpha subunit